MLKRFAIVGAMLCMLSLGFMARPALAEDSSETLLMSTEMLLISQANLAILGLNLISTNMEHDYTTADEDRENLQTIAESVDLAQEMITALSKATDIDANDRKLLNAMSDVNKNLKGSANELVRYCDDNDAEHFANMSNMMNKVVDSLGVVSKLLGD